MHDFKNLDRTSLKFENNLHAQRLLPWPQLNAPFEGSWCVIDAHSASTPHSHHEYEIFIALSGVASIVSEGKKTPFVQGDIVRFDPATAHSVVNDSDEPFEMYSIWWDTDMATNFLNKHTLTTSI